MSTPPSNRAAQAVAVLSALNGLDPHLAERVELEAAGVPEATAYALYPFGFEELSEGLLNHLRAHGVEHLRSLDVGDLGSFTVTALGATKQLRGALKGRFVAEQPMSRTGHGNQALRTYIWQELYPLVEATQISNNFASLTLRAWWLGRHAAELPRHLQVNNELRLNWVAKNLLPELVSKIDSQPVAIGGEGD